MTTGTVSIPPDEVQNYRTQEKRFFVKITDVKPPFRQEANGVYLGNTKVFDNVVAVK